MFLILEAFDYEGYGMPTIVDTKEKADATIKKLMRKDFSANEIELYEVNFKGNKKCLERWFKDGYHGHKYLEEKEYERVQKQRWKELEESGETIKFGITCTTC